MIPRGRVPLAATCVGAALRRPEDSRADVRRKTLQLQLLVYGGAGVLLEPASPPETVAACFSAALLLLGWFFWRGDVPASAAVGVLIGLGAVVALVTNESVVDFIGIGES